MGNDLISETGLIHIIEESRQNALKKVNEELIKMYWKVGAFLSKEAEHVAYGDAYIDEISREIQEAFPGMDIHMDPLSLSVACHIGQGSLAIACAKKVRI